MLKNNFRVICFILLAAFSLSFCFAEDNRDQSSYNQQIEKANKYFQQGLYQNAREILWETIDKYSNKPDAYINLASIYIKNKNFETAIRLLKKAEEKSDEDYFQREILFYNLGLTYYFNQNYQKAKEYLSQAIGIYPDFVEAYFYLAETNQKLGNLSKAYLNYFYANYIFSQKNNNYYAQLTAKRINNLKSNQELNKKTVAKKMSVEADQAIKNNNLNKAVHFLEKSIELYPNEIITHRKLAELYAEQGAFHNAAIYFNKLKEVESSSEVYLELGRVYRALGKYDLALKNFENAANLNKDNPQIPYEISLTYMKSKQYHTADKFIQEADQKATKKKDRKILEKINQMESEINRQLSPETRGKPKQRTKTKSFDYFSETKTKGNSGYLNKGYFIPTQD